VLAVVSKKVLMNVVSQLIAVPRQSLPQIAPLGLDLNRGTLGGFVIGVFLFATRPEVNEVAALAVDVAV